MRLAGDREEDTDRREAHDERRPAGAHERQRDPGDRQERDDDRDVDERLECQPGRDARRQQATERVGRAERDPHAVEGEDEEEADDDEPAEQPELLGDDGEDEVVRGIREIEAAGLRRLAETLPQETPEAQGEETLDRVEADPLGIPPGIEEGLDAG